MENVGGLHMRWATSAHGNVVGTMHGLGASAHGNVVGTVHGLVS